MKKIMRRLTTLLLAVMVFASSVITVSAADAETDARMKEALTNRQYYVYQLTNIMTDARCRMNATVVDDDYFESKTMEALKGIFGFEDTSTALFGSDNLEKKYYRKVMAECVMPGSGGDTEDINWTLTGLTEETLYEKSKKHLKEIGVSEEEMNEFEFAHGVTEYGLLAAEECSEAGQLLQKVCNYSTAHLDAIELIARYSEQGSSVSESAKWVVKASDSTEFNNAFENYILLLYDGIVDGGIDVALGIFTGSVTEYINIAFEILAGDKYEAEMNELFYLNLQNEISKTFYNLTDKYPNILYSQCTPAEIQDLTNLTLLFLRCGQLGFELHYPENADACGDMYRDLQTMEFPWVETEGSVNTTTSNISAIDYNVPGIISQGDYFAIFGTILSDEPISSVKVEAVGDNGYFLAEENNINSYQYNIEGLDTRARFNDLMPGTYRYVVTASTASGEYTVISSEFQILNENHEMTIVNYRLPHTMNVGDVFCVSGTVKSKTAMSNVSVEIRDMAGNYMTGGTAEGSYNIFDLVWLDRYVEFNKIPAGRYRYIVKATNTYGEEVLVNQEYLVK